MSLERFKQAGQLGVACHALVHFASPANEPRLRRGNGYARDLPDLAQVVPANVVEHERPRFGLFDEVEVREDAAHRAPHQRLASWPRWRAGHGEEIAVEAAEDAPLELPAPDVLVDDVRGDGAGPGIERAVASIAFDGAHEIDHRLLRHIAQIWIVWAKKPPRCSVHLGTKAIVKRRRGVRVATADRCQNLAVVERRARWRLGRLWGANEPQNGPDPRALARHLIVQGTARLPESGTVRSVGKSLPRRRAALPEGRRLAHHGW